MIGGVRAGVAGLRVGALDAVGHGDVARWERVMGEYTVQVSLPRASRRGNAKEEAKQKQWRKKGKRIPLRLLVCSRVCTALPFSSRDTLGASAQAYYVMYVRQGQN